MKNIQFCDIIKTRQHVSDFLKQIQEAQEAPKSFSVQKTNEDKHLVFGWASIAITADGAQLEDLQRDIIDPADLEDAVYQYVLNFRDGGEEHNPLMRKKASLIESVIFTKEKMAAMGIPEGILPEGWWIGFYVKDEEAWQKIKDGTYKMFSIEGKAVREDVEEEDPTIRTVAKSFNQVIGVEKFNPFHDRLGRFARAEGFMASGFIGDKERQAVTFSANPRTKEGSLAIARHSDPESGHEILGGAFGSRQIAEITDKVALAGTKKGKPMTREQANSGNVNPEFNSGDQKFRVNCQTCVVAFEARLRGYDVTAKPMITKEQRELARNSAIAWIDPLTGSAPKEIRAEGINNAKACKTWLEENVQAGARYTLANAWKGKNYGHIISVDRDGEGAMRLYDPQSGKVYQGKAIDSYIEKFKHYITVRDYFGRGSTKFSLTRLMRVDNLEFNPDIVDHILEGK